MNAARAALAATQAQALANVIAAQAAAEAGMVAIRAKAEEAIAAYRVEADKTVEDEFGVGFFQGYSDLKRRVALAHPE